MSIAYRLSLLTMICDDGSAGVREPVFSVVRASKPHRAGGCCGPRGVWLLLICTTALGVSIGWRTTAKIHEHTVSTVVGW